MDAEKAGKALEAAATTAVSVMVLAMIVLLAFLAFGCGYLAIVAARGLGFGFISGMLGLFSFICLTSLLVILSQALNTYNARKITTNRL